MEVILINTPVANQTQVNRDMAGGLGFDGEEETSLPPLDLLMYATVLNQNRHQAKVIDTQNQFQIQDWISQVGQFEPDAVVLTLSLPSFTNDIEFCQRLRSALGNDALIVFKTAVSSEVALEHCLRHSDCNFVLTGECDLSIHQILEQKCSQGTARLIDDVLVKNRKRCSSIWTNCR